MTIAFYTGREFYYNYTISKNETLIQENPDNVQAYSDIAWSALYKFPKNPDLAIKNFNNALKIDPEKADFYFGLGLAYLNKNQTNSAIENFNKAKEINPDYSKKVNNILKTINKK